MQDKEQKYEVHYAEYMGELYWADYPPLEFDSYQEALDHANVINALQQTDGNTKLRGIYPVKQ